MKKDKWRNLMVELDRHFFDPNILVLLLLWTMIPSCWCSPPYFEEDRSNKKRGKTKFCLNPLQPEKRVNIKVAGGRNRNTQICLILHFGIVVGRSGPRFLPSHPRIGWINETSERRTGPRKKIAVALPPRVETSVVKRWR